MEHSGKQRIGYARTSTIGQKLDSQIDALTMAGCIKIFSDQTQGITKDRIGWQQLMEYIRPSDTLIITELSRMSRSLGHLIQVLQELRSKQIEIVSLREHVDTSTATGRFFLSMMGAIAQMERELKAERAAAGRAAAKARGRTGGRPRTAPEKLEQARILYENSEKTAFEVCRAVGIGKRTLFYYLAQKRKLSEQT